MGYSMFQKISRVLMAVRPRKKTPRIPEHRHLSEVMWQQRVNLGGRDGSCSSGVWE